MKKLVCMVFLAAAVTCSAQQSGTVPRDVLVILPGANGTNTLTLNGDYFTGTRAQALSYEKVRLVQPIEERLMILNADGTGGFSVDNRMLFIQASGVPYWQSVTDSYRLGGTIQMASMQDALTIVVSFKTADGVVRQHLFSLLR